jgi:hypothetical protein
MEMAKFRKKPVEIEAVQWTGKEEDLDVVFALIPKKEDGSFDLPNDRISVNPGIGYVPASGEIDIPTLEGTMTASPGDWIIKGVKGEVYPCKPDIFELTYELIEN